MRMKLDLILQKGSKYVFNSKFFPSQHIWLENLFYPPIARTFYHESIFLTKSAQVLILIQKLSHLVKLFFYSFYVSATNEAV